MSSFADFFVSPREQARALLADDGAREPDFESGNLTTIALDALAAALARVHGVNVGVDATWLVPLAESGAGTVVALDDTFVGWLADVGARLPAIVRAWSHELDDDGGELDPEIGEALITRLAGLAREARARRIALLFRSAL